MRFGELSCLKFSLGCLFGAVARLFSITFFRRLFNIYTSFGNAFKKIIILLKAVQISLFKGLG